MIPEPQRFGIFYILSPHNLMIMKTLKAAILCTSLFFAVTAHSQNNGVEKSIFSIQTGTIGAWASNEARLADKWALRSEIGLDLWYYDSFYHGSGTILVPGISLEPRWYYNIIKREGKGKNTANNSANFLTLAVEYYPNLFLLGNAPDYVYVPDQVSFIPKWGMRRAIAGSDFNYELGFGIGYLALLNENDRIKSSTGNVAVDLHIRIGYTIK